MKHAHHLLLMLAVCFLVCIAVPGYAAVETDAVSQFPEGTVVVPMGTVIHIDDDANTVTIEDSPVSISVGDTFVVYLKDLPIGFNAESVDVHDGSLTITVSKADKSIYSLYQEAGSIALTPDLYEFIPSDGVSYVIESAEASSPTTTYVDTFAFKDKDLTVSFSPITGVKFSVVINNLALNYDLTGENYYVTLSGDWKFSTSLSSSEDTSAEIGNEEFTNGQFIPYEDFLLGQIRIGGVGKIALKLDINTGITFTYSFAGTFNAGFTTNDGRPKAIKDFNVTDKSVQGKGSISVALKITGGIDILIAEADIFTEIGVETEISSQTTYVKDTIYEKKGLHCFEYRIYLFSNIGIEAKYINLMTKKTHTLYSAELELVNKENSPFCLELHFEEGQLTGGCSLSGEEQIQVPSSERSKYVGNVKSNYTGTLLSEPRERVLETSVSLPVDVKVESNYTIANGDLDLNDQTLEIDGDLIQSGGRLIVGNGTLIVHGDYRLQSKNGDTYSESSGTIEMNSSEGQIIVDGNIILQPNSSDSSLYAGLIAVGKNFYYKESNGNHVPFKTDSNLKLCMIDGTTHVIHFDNSKDCTIGRLSLASDTSISNSIRIEELDLNGYQLTVQGDMVSAGNSDLNNGVLDIKGSLTHSAGELFVNGGKVYISGNYYIIGEDSVLEDGKRSLIESSGSLKMIYEADEVHVDGDFITKSVNHHESILCDGAFYLSGDCTELYGNHPINNFRADGEHRTILNGSRQQVISFEDPYCRFAILETSNEQLVFEQNVCWISLDSNLHATSHEASLGLQEMSLNGFEVTIDGDIIMNADIDLLDGVLTINGTLLQNNGELFVNGGKVNISGNYYIIGQDSVFETGKEDIASSEGLLKMLYPADEVRVGENFITKTGWNDDEDYLRNGTLYISGNFTELWSGGIPASKNFRPSLDHKTILNGTGKQTISFELEYCRFGTLIAENEDIVFQQNVSWLALESDVHATSEGASLGDEEMNLNGYNLFINGDIVLNASMDLYNGSMTINGSLLHSNGELFVNGGQVVIRDNYYVIGKDSSFEAGKEEMTPSYGLLSMLYPADEVYVGGNFITKSWCSDNLSYGFLYISGNFTQLENSAENFHPGVNHTTVLNGTNTQTVKFESEYCGFGTLLSQNNDLVFENYLSWASLDSDIYAKSNNVMFDTTDHSTNISMNGHNLTIEGDTYLNGNLDVSNGILAVNGSLYHYNGVLLVNGGKITIKDNYYMIGLDSCFEEGKEELTLSYGSLNMSYPKDEVHIRGDWIMISFDAGCYLKNGTLYLEGDFIQYNSWYFSAEETSTVVLCGTSKQMVSMDDKAGQFGTLVLTQPLSQYSFSYAPCWKKIVMPDPFINNSFSLPAYLNTIDDSAFESIPASVIYLPDTCTTIGAYAFRNAAVTQIRIPANCIIADTAFDGCELVYIFGTPGSEAETFCEEHDNCVFVQETAE